MESRFQRPLSKKNNLIRRGRLMNNIPQLQNSEHALWLLAARQQTYARATVWQLVQFAATVILPMAFAVLAIACPQLRAGLATASLLLVLIDIMLFDRLQKRLLQRAAKIAEQYDHEILQLPWNDFVVGEKIDPEDIEEAAAAYPKNSSSQKKLVDWYPVAVERAPLHVARIACQLANLRYDATLRKFYAAVVLWLPAAIFISAVLVAGFLNLAWGDVVLSVFAPATPIIVWSLRERFRHRDTAAAQEIVKATADDFWRGIKDRNENECADRAREFQDAIYLRRVSSPLIFPFIYGLLRNKMEAQMNKGADERLTQAGY